MDNLTHSLIGLGIGELLQRSLAPEAEPGRNRARRRMLLFSCCFASNMPDLDLLLAPLLPTPLGYLLYHRGHSHTVLFAMAQALLLAVLIWLLWPAARALLRTSGPARAALAASVTLGLGLHLAMDYLNSYGLHPFYPFDARWFYGDALFIVEPLFWVAFGVPLALTLKRPVAQGLPLAALGGALCIFAARGFLAWPACAALCALGLGLAALQRRAGARGRQALWAATVLCLGFIALQGGAAALGKRRVALALLQADPGTRVLDVALSAYPSQPLCWSFVTVESKEAAGTYRLRRGILSLAPAWLAPSACPAGLAERHPRASFTPAMLQEIAIDGSLAQLRRLKSTNCQVDAWLRFARAPALGVGVASDVRFGSGPDGNFTTLRYASATPSDCPLQVPAWAFPAWSYPRADLLEAP
ncbi:inner membrane protein [Oxalobacteraceae bacterium GrIS 1.11]